jgi:cytochrome b
MLLGGVAAFAVALRVVWGLVGSRYARFGSFAFGPSAVIGYLKGVAGGTAERHVGHNPGSSVAIFAMLALTVGLAASGALISKGKLVKELHEVLAYTLMAVVVVHVVGVVLHTVRHRENIIGAMVDGRKQGSATQAIPSSHALVALVFLALCGGWSATLVRGYDASTHSVTLPVLATRIPLGEAEKKEKRKTHSRGSDGHD